MSTDAASGPARVDTDDRKHALTCRGTLMPDRSAITLYKSLTVSRNQTSTYSLSFQVAIRFIASKT